MLDQTYPQLMNILKRKGRMLFPWVRPQLEYQFGKMYADDKELQAYLNKQRNKKYDMEHGIKPKPTPQDERYLEAWEFFTAEYRYEPEVKKEVKKKKVTMKVKGMSPSVARAILAWLKEDDGNACAPEFWIRDVQRMYPHVVATADVIDV